MAKKVVSKWFRIGVEGDTCDGRIIGATEIQEMADTFDPRVYGCRINLEHIKGLMPDSTFKRYGDVVELKAEKIEDDSALKGKLALFAKITPTDELVAMNKALQKVYTSMEIQPNFGNSGKCYLIGLAVTDDPASLGTEYLEFCRTAKHNPLNSRKASPENFFSAATLAEIEFEEEPDTLLNRLTDSVKAIFSRQQTSTDARFNDVHEAVTAIAERVQTSGDGIDTRFSALESQLAEVKQGLEAQTLSTTEQFSAITATLDNTPSGTQPRRKLSTGGDGAGATLTDC
ncbi:MAG: family capsid scaffolding protein [Proteobacteria bacterium]|nr:family capsid scaffolding protein [Pseudomonadota bacterium]